MIVAVNEQGITVQNAWVIGRNQVGCLPDGELISFDDWDNAFAAFKEMAEMWADESDELYDNDHDDCGGDRATVDSILADEIPTENEDYGMFVVSNNGTTIELWLRGTNCEH